MRKTITEKWCETCGQFVDEVNASEHRMASCEIKAVETPIVGMQTTEEKVLFIRRGGSLRIFKPADIVKLQEYALNIKDVRLYDYLEKFWQRI